MSLPKLVLRRLYILTVVGLILIAALAIAMNVHPASGGGTWWNTSWRYRKLITIDHTKVAASLTSFPVLVDVSDSDLTSKAQQNGNDIVFTDSSMKKLAHEIERYDNNSGHLVAWVKTDLSSTTDTVLYMYYGNAASANQQNPTAVWDSDYVMVQHLEETPPPSAEYWHKYEGNPILNGTRNGFASVFYETETSTYHLFCGWSGILHFTSPNGKTAWTADPSNPVLASADVPMVWKEGTTWYMLYRYGSPMVIGLANSTDATHWTKYEGNPVLTGVTGTWEDPSYGLDPWGAIKIDSTYYLWYNTVGGGALGRCIGLATSTNLKLWTKDTNNPIFQGGRFCSYSFKYGSYYYMLVPHYLPTSGYGDIELYRDVNPTFYPSSRQYLGVPITYGPSGAWDDHRFDTPAVFTDTIYRDTYVYSNNELWTYYGGTGNVPGGPGADWWTGMCIDNITQALSRQPITYPPIAYDSSSKQNNGAVYGTVNRTAAGKIDGAYGFLPSSDYIDCGDNSTLKGMNSLTVEAWVKPNAKSGSGIVSKWASWTQGSYLMWQNSAGSVGWGVITQTSNTNFYDTPVLEPGQWYHLVGVYDGSQIRLYENATQAGTPKSLTGIVGTYATSCNIGRYAGSVYMNGTLDEVRISNVSRSVGWITTEYNNQRSPSTFYAVGSEENALAKLFFSPSLVEKGLGDIGTTFIVQVTLQDVKDLWGFDFNLTWDSTLITLVGVEFNTTLDAIWGAGNWFVASNNSSPGYYKLAAVSTLNGFNSTGSHALATLTFRVEDPHSNLQVQTPIHFGAHKLSDSQWQPIDNTAEDGTYRISGEKPSLNMIPTAKTCRQYGETFTIQVNVSNAYNLTDFEFEIDFNTTLLDYSSINWDAWGTGTVTVSETGGNITGSTSGSMLSGDHTLITIEFKAAFYRIWKDLPGWTNDQSGKVYIQWANLSYPSGPDLGYVRGGLNQISMGPDVAYTFSPVQGDIDNNGEVDLYDLRTVSYYYDQTNATYNLTGDSIIDIFDLVVIGSNFGYTYHP